jgi:hypothetical protein
MLPGVKPNWALWKRNFSVRRQGPCQIGGFGCFTQTEVKYFNLKMLENDQSWRSKWFYAKDLTMANPGSEVDEFQAVSNLQARLSWENVMTKEEMAATEPLMTKIQDLCSTPGKELTSIQLIRLSIEHRVQPLSARTHCMWDYSGRKDSTRVFDDELKVAEINERIRLVTSVLQKDEVPKHLSVEPFGKDCPCAAISFV